MKNNMVKLAFLLFFMFAGNANSEDIYIHDLSGDANFRQELNTLITIYKRTVVFGDTLDSLVTTGGKKVGWIIYIGHGSSCDGSILGGIRIENGKRVEDTIKPETLESAAAWQNVTGVLIFGCAVIDIGDYGRQHSKGGVDKCGNNPQCGGVDGPEGNYCKKYFETTHHPNEKGICLNPVSSTCQNMEESPDPGLRWEQLASNRNIQYILGFNFRAPTINEDGGSNVLTTFLNKWFLKGGGGDNFLAAWKEKITSSNIIERGFIQKGSDGHYWYSMGRANDSRLIWTNLMNIKNYREACYFSDIPKTAFYHSAVTDLCYYQNTISKPAIFPNRAFRPNDYIKKGEFLTMLMRFKRNVECTKKPKCFAEAAKEDGIIEKSDINLDSHVTRAEIAKMVVIAKYPHIKDQDVPWCNFNFSDVSNSDWFSKYVCVAKAKNIMTGYKDGKFNPLNSVNRADAAVILRRLHDAR